MALRVVAEFMRGLLLRNPVSHCLSSRALDLYLHVRVELNILELLRIFTPTGSHDVAMMIFRTKNFQHGTVL